MRLQVSLDLSAIEARLETQNTGYKIVLPAAVHWSTEDQAYIGSLNFIGACCHGSTIEQVTTQLQEIAESWLFTPTDRLSVID